MGRLSPEVPRAALQERFYEYEVTLAGMKLVTSGKLNKE
jgi:hypothetical protein